MSVPAGPGGTAFGGALGPRTDHFGPGDFAHLYQQHWRLLWCAAVGVVNDRTLALDIVQQAAVVGLERLSQFDPATSFTAWMTQIVRNIALNEGRKRGRRRTVSTSADHLDHHAGTTSASTNHEPALGGLRGAGVLSGRGQIMAGAEPFDDELAGALDDLDETARGCLLMRVVLDMPYKEIALALDIPEGTAASHVHRSRAALRHALRPPAAARKGGGA